MKNQPKLNETLEDYKRDKARVRSRLLSSQESEMKNAGFEMTMGYTNMIERASIDIFNYTRNSFEKHDSEIGLFLYGSPCRREMVCESDLDIMLVYDRDTPYSREFKNRFLKNCEPFNFVKVDLPEWLDLDEIAQFVNSSYVEGNQILEARFIAGSKRVRNGIRSIKREYGTEETYRKVIAFQNNHFEQYFKDRTKAGFTNIKYSEGGNRDLLFLHWFNSLMLDTDNNWISSEDKTQPTAKTRIEDLNRNLILSSDETQRTIDAINFILALRNETLIVNRDTEDEGLSFLGEPNITKVYDNLHNFMKFHGINSPNGILATLDEKRRQIKSIKDKIFDITLEVQGKAINESAYSHKYKIFNAQETPEKDRAKYLHLEDTFSRIGMIWGASKSNQQDLFNELCKLEKDNLSWGIQASICSSKLCQSDYLHHIASSLGKENGFGYILKLISRNRNVTDETLRTIANDSSVRDRDKRPAIVSLEQGREVAKHLI